MGSPYRLQGSRPSAAEGLSESAGVSKSSAGVRLAYAKHNGVTPPMRKMYMLKIPFSPPMNFPPVPKKITSI